MFVLLSILIEGPMVALLRWTGVTDIQYEDF